MKKANSLILQEQKINKKELERKQEKEKFKEELKQEKQELREEIKQEKTEINKREKESTKRENHLKREQEKIIKVKELRVNTKKLSAELRSIEKKLAKKSKILIDIPKREDELKQVEEELLKKKTAIEKKEKNLELEKEQVKNKQKKYESEMDDLMDEEFHRYLQKNLSNISPSASLEIKDKEYQHNEIYVLIDNCRGFIDSKDFGAAKELYNKIRSQFTTLDLKDTEKQILKNTIKELYQEINLASLS